ncbi:MAG: sugar phosphate nucleotidyltransferase [Candidatus Kapaibacterium sp.]|jgi:glucose-1-phosphate thymidylyltransferase
MRAIIPVAGYGTRLRPHTYSLPKVLLNVAGKPILGHILDSLLAENITDATIVIGYMGDMIRQFVEQNYSLNVEFVQQDQPLGLGHSIWCARDTFDTEPVFIILGDTIFDVNLAPVLASENSMLGVKYVEDPRRFGVVESSDGVVTRLIEKPENPTSHMAIVGLYHIRNSSLLKSTLNELVTNDIRTRGEYQLTDALQMMIDRGETFGTFPVEGWYDCGKPETMLETNRHLLGKQSAIPSVDGSVIIPPVFIGRSAVVERSVIGPYATVAEGATVKDAHIRNSIVSNGATVTGTLMEDSIVGNNAVVRGRFKRLNVGDSSEINDGEA